MLKPLLTGLILAAPAIHAAPYTTRPLSELASFQNYQALATLSPRNESRLTSELSARIDSLPASLGSSVKKGSVLVKLDDRQYRLAVDQAAAQLSLQENRRKLARLQLEQTRALSNSQFVSAQALAQRETELAVIDSEISIARTSLAQAKLALDKTVIRAPFDGVVKERLAAVGETASPGQVLLSLSQQNDSELRARVPQADITSLQQAGKWQFRSQGKDYALKLLRIAPQLDSRTQTREVIFAPANEAPAAGSSGQLQWRAVLPAIPARLIVEYQGKRGVWRETAGKLQFVALPQAQAGRPLTVDWPLDTRLVDEGRFALGKKP